jgi:hypothetical protein
VHCDVAVQVRQAAIKSRQLSVAASCELSKVGISHLSVTDDSGMLVAAHPAHEEVSRHHVRSHLGVA